jgi:hypothetical protein
MNVSKIQEMILRGELDEHLPALRKEIDTRVLLTREFIEWVEGDRVRINERCRPKYLCGVEATITGVRRTRVTIRLDKTVGRFSSERDITIPVDLLDKI